jgi:hypothetical protein
MKATMTLLRRKIGFDQGTMKYLVTALLFSLLLSGCVISPRRTLGGGGGGGTTPSPTPSPTPTPQPAVQGILYVANPGDDSIVRFANAASADGNLAPAATIQGNLTTLNSPNYIFLDSVNDRLYVTNQGNASILVFDSASTLTGDPAPSRTITGGNTGLTIPVDVAVDSVKDLLYVVNGAEVLVFSPASSVSNDAVFTRDIQLPFQPSAMFLDAANDRLFLADAVGNAINVYDNASTQNGAAILLHSIKGASTKMNGPSGVAVDAVGKLIVLNQGGNSITIYPDAAGGDGDVPAAAEIAGASTTLSLPFQLAVNRSNTLVEAFVANSNGGNVPIFSDLGARAGNIAPSRNIHGTATTLTLAGAPTGIALDPTR